MSCCHPLSTDWGGDVNPFFKRGQRAPEPPIWYSALADLPTYSPPSYLRSSDAPPSNNGYDLKVVDQYLSLLQPRAGGGGGDTKDGLGATGSLPEQRRGMPLGSLEAYLPTLTGLWGDLVKGQRV